ncbi:toll/interleukin-1 receptor domain-containing protein [Leptolyngbya sp. BC1307]|uniref:toll/interleukin-1 receptor domain-containing protein n=1 Tax=Leptolyngbya sp. BC1307 TaxID=2029589 RepID=UPI000EFD9600|nr:toll/interleukin-1 receptor domain-containing protein [Leptolyngbya sp. BC1307]
MTNAPPSIFISYSHTDEAYVRGLVKAFESRGLSVWLDNHINYGAQWQQVIEANLRACRAFVLVMTPRSNQSHWVNCELALAVSLNKKIFPILLEGDSVWFNVYALQSADVREGRLPSAHFFEDMIASGSDSIHVEDSRSSVQTLDLSTTISITESVNDDLASDNSKIDGTELQNLAWAGDWFVNVGEGVHRDWDDCVKYGFISAGQGSVYSDALRKLEIGSTIYAYISGLGYVGLGKVTEQAVPIKDFTVGREKMPLLSLDLKAEKPSEHSDNLELSEWVIGIKWLKTFPKDNPQRFVGAFANPNVVCKLRNKRTLEFLREKFGWAGDWFVNIGERQGHLLWEDCLRYGCISAGGGQKYRDAIQKLQPGNVVYAYIAGAGYVGYGKVVENAVPVKDFMARDVPLLEQTLATVRFEEHKDKNNLEISDWVARIKWLKTYKREQARFFPGAFVHRGTLCRLGQRETLEFLHQEFGISDSFST